METIFFRWDSRGVLFDSFTQLDTDPIPANSTSTAPPEIPEGKVALWAGGWFIGDEPAALPPQPAPTLEQRRTQVSQAIDLHAKELRDNVVQLISPAEMSSWPIKQAEAKAFVASGNDADAPMLVAEAGYRQVTTAELVDMVLAKAQQLAGLEAMISGECGRRQDILRTLDDIEMIDAFAAGVRFGWLNFPDPAQ